MVIGTSDPRPPTRQELARVFGDNPRLIRAFEKIFDLIPPELIELQTSIEQVDILAALATSKADDAIAQLTRLADAVEQLALMPRLENKILDDLIPVVQIGTLGEQQADRVDIAGGSVIATLADNTSSLISSIVTLSSNAGSSSATLTNAPSAGNPTKWVSINDNGITRYIPTWT